MRNFTLSLIISVLAVLFGFEGYGQVVESFDGYQQNVWGNYSYDGFDINNGVCNATNARSGKAVWLRDAEASLEYVGLDGNGKDGGVGVISFYYRAWNSAFPVNYNVQVNINGAGYVNVGSAINTSSTTYALWEHTLNDISDNIKVRVNYVGGGQLHIDDFTITDFSEDCTGQPTAQASDIYYLYNSETSVHVHWSAGAGMDNYILVGRQVSPVSFTPTDGVDYSGGTGGGNFAAASTLVNGNKVVYAGNSTSAAITGLTVGATYYFRVFAVCIDDNHNYLTAVGNQNDGTSPYNKPVFIPDDGCDSDDYFESTFEFSGVPYISDIDVFVSIPHQRRSELQIKLISPQNTEITLQTGAGGWQPNLEVIFDDDASNPVSGDAQNIDWIADEIVKSSPDLLSAFNGENPNGTWKLRVCDLWPTDVGYLNGWYPIITTPCAFENFENSNVPILGSSYVSGSFIGNDGVTWTYSNVRDENGDANNSGIDGKAIMLQQSIGKISSSSVPGGISDFSVKLYKGFTGGNNRRVELFVNGVSQGTSTPFNDFDEHIFTVNGIDIPGDVVIEVRNITANQVIIDDINWICYTSAPIVQFESSGISTSENSSSIELCVELLYPDELTTTSVDIALTGTGSPHLSYTTTTVTFPAGSSGEQCVTIPITDDLICGNSQDYVFTLQNVTGPPDVTIGSEDEFILTINDDDSSSGTIVKQGFEGDATETFTFTNTNGGISSYNSGTPNNQRIRSGSQSFQVNDEISSLNFAGQNISSFTNVELEIWNSSISHNTAGNGADAGDFIKVYVSKTSTFSSIPNISIEGNDNAKYGMNGTKELSIIAPATMSHTTPSGSLTISNSPSKMVVSIPDAWNNLYVKIELKNNNANEVWCLDDIRLRGITCNACVNPTITSINPTSGPKETVVTIIGTNFITGGALTDVQFGGVSASSYTVVSDTELTAVVPTDAVTGAVKVLRGSCNDTSSENFTFLEEDCETGTASLIISELCDPQSGFDYDRYIEIYNPSDIPINLNGWTLYSLSNATNINNQSGISWPLSGMIGAGQAMTCGYTTPSYGGTHNFQNALWNTEIEEQGSSQWNGKKQDGAALYNGTTRVDAIIINSGSTVNIFENSSLIRNADICEPNPDAPFSEWTRTPVTNAGSGASTPRVHNTSCVLLTGADPSIITETTPNISEPICNQTDVTITASSSSVISYQWYYNDGSATWTEIIDNAAFSGATTPTLSITNLVGLEDYQFYCRLITDLACINYSRAIQVEVLPNDKIYFKSQTDGLWSDPVTWDFSDAISGSYSDACIYPNSSNSILVEIETGQVVTYDLDASETIPSVWVLSGSTLETQSNKNLRIENVDPTTELIVDGTFIDNAASGSSIAFLNGATWELGAAGTIVKTNTSSVAQYRDNYESGIGNIPATANWIYRKIGPNNVTVATIDMVYPNLSFVNELLVGSYTPSSTYVFSGSSSSLRIKGDLKVGATGAQPYNMATINTNVEPILVEGDLYIGAGSSLTNSVDGIVGNGFEVQGDMDIEGTLDLTSGSGSTLGILKLSGNQDMIGVGGATILTNNLIIDKGAGFNILADLNFDVKREIKFINGILNLELPNNTVILPQGIIVSGTPGNVSHIDGFVSKSGTEDFRFPVGDAGYYQSIEVKDISAESTFRARYVAETHPETGPYYDGEAGANGILEELGHCDYWTLNRTLGSAAANVALTYGNNPCNVITDVTYLNIGKWDGISWEYPIIGVDPTSVINEISSTTPFPSFSDFVLASRGGANLNVLPIQLISFTATPENQKVKTQWSTHSETNNAFFTVERSADARVFHEIGKVTGAGNSHTTRHYALTDPKPLPSVSYYRLKQTDFDGQYTYSEIQAVSFKETSEFSLDLTYRDENDLNLVYKTVSAYILVEIFDVLGKRVFTEVAENYGGRSVLDPNLGRGAYVVRISAGDKSDTGKIVW